MRAPTRADTVAAATGTYWACNELCSSREPRANPRRWGTGSISLRRDGPSLRLCSGNDVAVAFGAGTSAVQRTTRLHQEVQPAANGPEARHRPSASCGGSIRGTGCTATMRCLARDRRCGHPQGETCHRWYSRCRYTARVVRADTIRCLFRGPIGAACGARRSRTPDGLAVARAGRRPIGRRGRLGRVARYRQ